MTNLPTEFVRRAKRLVSLHEFLSASSPIPIEVPICKPVLDRQYILRMMVRSDKFVLTIPDELKWMAPAIDSLISLQESNGLTNRFIYVTVRHGIVTSTTDDVWHADGFSMRTPHVPEQNYIYTDNHPTEWLPHAWNIPALFDPFKHNIHTYFQEHESLAASVTGEPGVVHLIDPYCVHRRPAIADGTMRTMWRVSFIPIEIEDDTCQRNPLFPVIVYGREDMRKKLVAWSP